MSNSPCYSIKDNLKSLNLVTKIIVHKNIIKINLIYYSIFESQFLEL